MAINDKDPVAADGVRGGVQYAVRLEPIRPSLEAAPMDDIDAEAGPIVGGGVDGGAGGAGGEGGG